MTGLIVLTQEQTDKLLEKVTEEISLKTFNFKDQSILKSLVECLGDTRGMTRLRAAQTLGEIGQPATPFLLDALANHSNVVVRRAAAKTLTLIADPQTIPQLIESFLNDEDTVVQGSSVGALARMGEAGVFPLLNILGSPDVPESAKGHAAWALAFIGPQAKQHLNQAVSHDSPVVRAAVVGAIAKVAASEPDQELLDILVNSLSDPDSNVRCETAAVLGNLTYQPAIPKLVELLHHVDEETRKSAALSLMKIGDPQVIEALREANNSESATTVQSIIKLAISQLEI
ncbi:HEAT domain containing protein (plasmid) [Rippkaea orientalis PCC 8801]|uniref:HEAT domain containing protein n=1 Tax=Rippkaea orientalis (strain PCC 8801 / RF-1) TaxID=41431 RepID=B7K6K0_RIPO1|nr:HEAT repeat domain-containing protein [Rippkaea orientalis]ACK68422.1 HEAT domain containing protein [Rippkaea orientalis PCC 8801]